MIPTQLPSRSVPWTIAVDADSSVMPSELATVAASELFGLGIFGMALGPRSLKPRCLTWTGIELAQESEEGAIDLALRLLP